MAECIKPLSDAVQANEAKGWQLAFLEDRVLMQSGKPQKYGTQHRLNEYGIIYPYEISDPKIVDDRRKALGIRH